jgi:integrase
LTVGINRLSDRAVKTLGPGKHSDGGGLYLAVDSSGARRWQFIYTMGGKRREMGLGGVHGLGLSSAREKARSLASNVKSGVDPLNEKRDAALLAQLQKAGQQTFGDFVDSWFEKSVAPGLSNSKSADQWRMTFKVYCEPMRTKPVAEITTDDVLGVLRPIWLAKPETASRLRGRIERALDAAVVKGVRNPTANPARWKGHLQHMLTKPVKLARGHHAAMPWQEIPKFLKELSEREAMTARALTFLILCGSRAGEVVGACWGEIDVVSKVWTIPAARMKRKKEHRVPVSDQAMEILSDLLRLSNGDPSALVFPGRTKRPLSVAGLDAVRERMGVANVTTHGFRSSFRDWCGDATDISREVSEGCLSHSIGNEVERAYRRGDALDKRRAALQQWADYCCKQGD